VKGCVRFAFALLMVLAGSPLLARATASTLHTALSESFTVYVDGPAKARAGVVLVHDWFGVSPFYAEAAARLAAQGYRVLR
jgi:dienelactone hydrolase